MSPFNIHSYAKAHTIEQVMVLARSADKRVLRAYLERSPAGVAAKVLDRLFAALDFSPAMKGATEQTTQHCCSDEHRPVLRLHASRPLKRCGFSGGVLGDVN